MFLIVEHSRVADPTYESGSTLRGLPSLLARLAIPSLPARLHQLRGAIPKVRYQRLLDSRERRCREWKDMAVISKKEAAIAFVVALAIAAFVVLFVSAG
jgi:hypothetical protein